MTDNWKTARIQALVEEELGEFRAFADVPASEIEEMAKRITRVIAPIVNSDSDQAGARKAA